MSSWSYSDEHERQPNQRFTSSLESTLRLVLVLTIRTEPLIKTDTNTNPRIGIGIGSTIRTDLMVVPITNTNPGIGFLELVTK